MRPRHYVIALSIMVALVLQIVPLPSQADTYRPDWVLVVLAYWTMALPHRVNVGVAFISGIALDILLGTPLGVHSLVLCFCVYILAANYQRLRNYSVWQQCVIIGLLSAFYHLLSFWLLHLLNDIFFLYEYMLPVVTSMAIWPWVFWLLRKLRRQLKIV
ncbi:rod shape-determining protein MreD [Alteromonas sediminis]|uniref:Rod shape-determining protein MreD n=1 Tax=Alteromonas sediminis TaxID=2259342 RepID=A0A3N5XXC6_9ALTE|nr:rod shape-determining protein MreD [Alteromonas sediminis]RPJ65472.1 rod shape-determining protein MreD [Alteromonas sediminis]